MKKLRTSLFEKKKKKVRLFENKNWDKKQKALKEKKKKKKTAFTQTDSRNARVMEPSVNFTIKKIYSL